MVLKRLRILVWLFAALFLAVEARLAHLQFVERDFWETEGRKTRLEGRAVPFKRGALLDRYGRVLAEGRQVHNLTLTYKTFRRASAIGALLGAGDLLAAISEGSGGPMKAPDLAAVIRSPERYAGLVVGLSEARIAGQPRGVQEDLRYYARRLLELDEGTFRALREAADPAAPWATFVDGAVERIATRVRDQVRYLGELAECAGVAPADLLASIATEIQGIDDAYQATVAAHPGTTTKQRRALRSDFEARDRTILRVLPYRAVFLVNLVPQRYAGISVSDVDARWYPDEVKDIAPMLIGWTGFPTDSVIADASEHRLRYEELRAHPAEQVDDRMAEEIEALRQGLRYRDYRVDEEMGRQGLEALLEPVLRGDRGWRVVEQDRGQNATKLLDYRAPRDGQDVSLTLDIDLQLACERVLESLDKKSSIVLIDPHDGAIRAMATWPEPTRDELRRNYGELLKDRDAPLSQRAYAPHGDMPPPGSIFKVVVSAAALENGTIDRGTLLTCEKTFTFGDRQYKCLGHHGAIAVEEALEHSCNIYFYRVALKMGVTPMIDMARRFGVGVASGFGSVTHLGMAPPATSIEEYAALNDTLRSKSDALQTAIGHGAVEDCTPLQMATFMAPFANGGLRVRPYLVDAIGSEPAPRDGPEPIGLTGRTLDIVRSGMLRVTQTGTARPKKALVDLAALGVVGKTGTPQTATSQHATFAGFFPLRSPKLVFAILVEDVPFSEGGGGICAPIMGQLVQQPELRDYLSGMQ